MQTKSNSTPTSSKKGYARSSSHLNKLIAAAMLSALAAVLMFFEVPLPFIAPDFYKLDFSEVPVLIGGFSLGPIWAVVIELVKILLKFVIKGTMTAGVGELANFLMGCAFVFPAALLYKWKKNRKTALLGMAAGTVAMAVAAVFLNAYLLLPAYAAAFKMPMEAFVQMGTAINPSIDGLLSFVILAVAPFNLFKGVVVSILVFFLYKPLSRLIHGKMGVH